MTEKLTDQALVESVKKGDKKAFNLLVARYQNKVASLLTHYIHSHEIADIAQETFIKAYRSIHTFRGESAFYTWLYRIAVNTAKNHLSSQNRRPPNEGVPAEDAENLQMGTALRDIASPENELFSDELKRIVFTTIAKMPEDLRLAITLREIDGLSYEEIAGVMNCPVGTVRSRIFRARELIEVEVAPLL